MERFFYGRNYSLFTWIKNISYLNLNVNFEEPAVIRQDPL